MFESALRIVEGDTLAAYVIPIFLLAMVVEVIWAQVTRRKIYRAADTATSLVMLIASAIVQIAGKLAVVPVMIWCHEISPLRDVVVRQPWAWLVLLFLDDLTYYWFHRLNHEVRFMWAGHVNHHSSESLHYGTALRQGVGEEAYKFVFWIWLPLLGFDPAMVLLMMGLNLTFQFWVHTEAVRRLPAWYEAIFNTPSHHRVHHGSNARYLDRNHAGIFIVWDKLFGTFSAELDEEPVEYGLTENLGTFNPLTVLVHGYTDLLRDMRRAESWRDRLRYLLMPPGWSHDGPDKRASTLRAKAGLGGS
ncbi:MAG: sterol desaturase family protein [Myxococcota bacterium]|nr:sterol desaturase family protein [Myxococcota bacterium]